MSASPLGGHIRKSDTPGVGEYNAYDGLLSKSASKSGVSPMFAGSSGTRGSNKTSATGTHVGPGSYELEGNSIHQKMAKRINPRSPGFGSSSVRNGPEV